MSLIEEMVARNNLLTQRNIEALNQLKTSIDKLPKALPPTDMIKIQDMYGMGQVQDYDKPFEVSLTTAVADLPITRSGDQVFALHTASDLDGVGIKLNSKDAPLIYFNDSNPMYGRFDKVYLTIEAAKTAGSLKMFSSRGRIFSPPITSSPPRLSSNQKKFSLLVTYRQADGDPIASNTVEGVAAYTVPAGWRLYIGGSIITCNISCIQKVVMTHTPGIIGDYRYDTRGEIIFTPLSSTILDPGDVLTIYVYNNHSDYADFSVTVVGVLESLDV